jgi:hypothetical protein
MDACNWNNRVNPVSGKRCNETFENMNKNPEPIKKDSFPEDPIVQFYFACIGLIGIYILYCLTRKTK